MPLKVIGAGFGRTGTLSLKVALEQLGFDKCYHMTEVLAHSNHARLWDAAAYGEPVDWDTLFTGFQATVDWPGCNFYEELLRSYPGAKVILTVRAPERWYDSAEQTIYPLRKAFPFWSQLFIPRLRYFRRMNERVIWDGTFKGRFEDKIFAIEVFNRHNEKVKATVPIERLLVFDVNEGWGPLCQFLNVPIPKDKAFPHLNDADELRSRIRRAQFALRIVAYATIAALASLLVWVVVASV